MKSSKKLYKKKMQPPKYAFGAVLASLAGSIGAPATGAAATGALSASTSAAIAGATGATGAAGTIGATSVGSGATNVGSSLPSTLAPNWHPPFKLPPKMPDTIEGINEMLRGSKQTPNLGSAKDAGWTGESAEDMATGNNANATNTTNAGNASKSATNFKAAMGKIKDFMEFNSPSDYFNLSQLPMMAVTGIRQSALERQKSRNNQMNFANNMNVNMDSGAYGDSGMMKKGGIMNSVAELTGQEYIVPKELIPYALEAGNAKLYASDKTDGAYSHETNPIQVYRAGGDIYVDEQGNTMKAGDLIVPEHKANSRAGIMSAINQNPYNNKADNGMPVPYTMEGFYRMLAGPGTTSGDLDKNNRKFDKYDAQMLGMGAYALGTNMLNRFAPAEQVRSVELINPREMQFNPYFMQRQAKDIANQYYNTSQYTKSGSLSDNMATAANAMEASNQVITKTGQDIANLSQDYDMKNAQTYNQALAENAKSINQVNAYNAELLQKSNAMKSEMNYKNMQELGKSIIGAQELRNMDKSQKIQEEVIKYQLAVQKMQAESDEAFKKYNMEYQKWLNDLNKKPENMPVIPTSPTMPSFTFPFK